MHGLLTLCFSSPPHFYLSTACCSPSPPSSLLPSFSALSPFVLSQTPTPVDSRLTRWAAAGNTVGQAEKELLHKGCRSFCRPKFTTPDFLRVYRITRTHTPRNRRKATSTGNKNDIPPLERHACCNFAHRPSSQTPNLEKSNIQTQIQNPKGLIRTYQHCRLETKEKSKRKTTKYRKNLGECQLMYKGVKHERAGVGTRMGEKDHLT